MNTLLSLDLDTHPVFAEMQFQDGLVGVIIFASTVAYLLWLIKRKI